MLFISNFLTFTRIGMVMDYFYAFLFTLLLKKFKKLKEFEFIEGFY